jgi:signal transduction histidine kinase
VERGVLVGVAALRWAAWVWLTVVALANLHRVHHPALVVMAVGATGAVTVAGYLALQGGHWEKAMRPPLLLLEVGVAAAVVAADGWVGQARITGQSLAGTWPLAAILVAGVAGGPFAGAAAGGFLGSARALAVGVAGTAPGQAGRAGVAVASTTVSWIVIGAVCGAMVRVLRRTQHRLAEAEVRERIARDLHDGVLQTLAIIERRSSNPELARLAREQERELRAYLFADYRAPGGLAEALWAAVAPLERAWPTMAVTVSIGDDVPPLAPEQIAAAGGATAEALTNAAKHGRAGHVVVFADLDESSGGLFLSIKDDGDGCDPATIVERAGMSHSIRGRIGTVGGVVDFASAPGDGSEVRITMPPWVKSERTRG